MYLFFIHSDQMFPSSSFSQSHEYLRKPTIKITPDSIINTYCHLIKNDGPSPYIRESASFSCIQTYVKNSPASVNWLYPPKRWRLCKVGSFWIAGDRTQRPIYAVDLKAPKFCGGGVPDADLSAPSDITSEIA